MPDNHTWEGRSRGTTLGYKIFVGLLRYGGLKSAYGLLHFVTLYYRLFARSATRPLIEIYSRMGFNPKEVKRLIKRNLYIFGQTLIDKITVLSGIKHSLSFTHEGVNNFIKRNLFFCNKGCHMHVNFNLNIRKILKKEAPVIKLQGLIYII